MVRWIRFFIAVLVGLGSGLAYGWFFSPTKSADTTLDTLRIDYKTDFVLMVAETYQTEGDPVLAVQRLSVLGNNLPTTLVEESIQFAQRAGYTEPDINRMQTLLSALEGRALDQGSSTK